MAAYGASLFGWLKAYTFPTESEFSDEAFARRALQQFLGGLVRSGTTTAVAYTTALPSTADILFEEAAKLNSSELVNKVGEPSSMTLDELRALAEEELAAHDVNVSAWTAAQAELTPRAWGDMQKFMQPEFEARQIPVGLLYPHRHGKGDSRSVSTVGAQVSPRQGAQRRRRLSIQYCPIHSDQRGI